MSISWGTIDKVDDNKSDYTNADYNKSDYNNADYSKADYNKAEHMTPSMIREAVRAGAIRPQKSLGQNFLIDQSYAERIAEAADVGPDDTVIEVGPGLCALTRPLCRRAGHVVAVEIDRFLVPQILQEMRGAQNFRLVHGDILKTPLDELLPDGAARHSPYKVVSNLPYSISSQVMMRFFEGFGEVDRPSVMVLMMQKEVADRLVAQPATKAYGSLTVAANVHSAPRRAFSVPPHCFVPQPGVDSTVVVLETRPEPPAPIEDRKLFAKVVRAAFAQRRKTLENCLMHAGLLPQDRIEAAATLAEAGVRPGARGETLTVEEFADVANAIAARSVGERRE